MKRNVATVLAVPMTVLLAVPACSQVRPEITTYSGACDASAAVAVDATMFVVANDEDDVLRVYRSDVPGTPVYTCDLTSFLRTDPQHPEADIEGATRVGDRVYWIASHGTNKNGKPRPSRRRLFATDLHVAGAQVTITPVGMPYTDLVRDLAASPELKDCKMDEAANIAPEAPGGLNIEGLCATPQGALLIGFRNPIPGGKALLVPLDNPKEVVEGQQAKLGKPIRLSLGGFGIRSIEYFAPAGKYLIAAGPHDDAGDFNLYRWSGAASEPPELIEAVKFGGLHAEALIVHPGEKTRVQFLTDDGTKQVGGIDCKTAAPEKRTFRGFWVNL